MPRPLGRFALGLAPTLEKADAEKTIRSLFMHECRSPLAYLWLARNEGKDPYIVFTYTIPFPLSLSFLHFLQARGRRRVMSLCLKQLRGGTRCLRPQQSKSG